ncbi:MAG: arginyl-tRNA--protein-N-Asp/Glu arginylyltransferase [Psychromonas sp.]|uniref:arginyltransferase n=1 Tax=Psychromonas sp. TaxID=1884585 RepID=UPI0039E62D1A
MSTKTISLNMGITKVFPCSYLANQKEQLIMLIDPQNNAQYYYPTLLANGFRRSGEQVYRPNCGHCEACQSLRINTFNFQKSRSQKRLLNKNSAFTTKISTQLRDCYYELYQNYINQVHYDGPMFPASKKQYKEFISSTWSSSIFIEIYDREKLIAVSVTDLLSAENMKAWSALYCFYDPDYRSHSLGKFAVLCQLQLAKADHVEWLYLGYYIKECQKMNYKAQFRPHQRFIGRHWIDFN